LTAERRSSDLPRGSFRQAQSTMSRRVGDDVVVAVAGREDFDFLSGPAATVWSMLDKPRSSADLVDSLGRIYDIPARTIEEGVAKVLAHLVDRAALETSDE